jgi:choline dehydrogenase
MQVQPDDPCGIAVLEAAAAVGLPTVRFNEGVTVCEGAGFFQINREPDGTRASSSRAYLHPIMGKRQNLEVRTGAWAAGARSPPAGRSCSAPARSTRRSC